MQRKLSKKNLKETVHLLNERFPIDIVCSQIEWATARFIHAKIVNDRLAIVCEFPLASGQYFEDVTVVGAVFKQIRKALSYCAYSSKYRYFKLARSNPPEINHEKRLNEIISLGVIKGVKTVDAQMLPTARRNRNDAKGYNPLAPTVNFKKEFSHEEVAQYIESSMCKERLKIHKNPILSHFLDHLNKDEVIEIPNFHMQYPETNILNQQYAMPMYLANFLDLECPSKKTTFSIENMASDE